MGRLFLRNIEVDGGCDGNQSAFTCSKSTVETLEQGVKYVQSYQ